VNVRFKYTASAPDSTEQRDGAEFENTRFRNKRSRIALKVVNGGEYFDILLTVHLSIILAINQLNAQNLVL